MQINSLLRTRLKEKTVIVISHMESVLKEMDQIVIMCDGKIVKNGVYSDIADVDKYVRI